MVLPAQLTIRDAAFALDGGTRYLGTTDEAGGEHTVVLAQHAFPRTHRSTDNIPGRLYFDRQLVPMRSEIEARVLSLLGSAATEDDILRASVAEIIEFVESEHYLRFAERVEQAADDTRYDVWLDWDAQNRKQVILRLGSFLGCGLRVAAEMLEQGRPLAEGISALEVSDLAAQYRGAGLGVRVSPAFRWRLP